MTVKLVFEPSITVVSAPRVNPDAVILWAHEIGIEDALDDPNSPLSKLIERVRNDPSTSPEALIELAGRQCYRSYAKGREADQYLENLLAEAHGSVLRHSALTFAVSGVSRTLTHELVRHAAGIAISQESQRYVDAKDIGFVIPPLLLEYSGREFYGFELEQELFESFCEDSLKRYVVWQEIYASMTSDLGLTGHIRKKRTNEAARSVLPGCVETRLYWTANIQAIRFVIKSRGTSHADLEIRRFACYLLNEARCHAPKLLEDLVIFQDEDGLDSVKSVTGYKI